MTEEPRIMDEIKALAQKVDAFPGIVRDEIKSEISAAAISFGIDPGNPTETQELVSYIKRKKRRDDQISKRTIDNFSNLVFKAFIILLSVGFIAFYTQSLVTSAIQKEFGIIDTGRRQDKTESEKRG